MSIICLETDRKRSYFLCLFVLLTVKDETMSEKAMNQLKKELEGVIGGLNERLGELQNLARKQQAKVVELEKERDRLEDELTKRDDMEGNVDLLQRQLDGEMQLVVSN